jgi:hypothetical protein
MNKVDLERVMAKEPTLNIIGFGLSNLQRYTLEERRRELAENRERLLGDVEVCSKVCDWLKEKAKERATLNREMGSYGWKHVIEKEIGEYVANGVFIAAAIHCGFNYKLISPESPNAYFNICKYRRAKSYCLA